MRTEQHFPRTSAQVSAGLLSTLPAVRPAAPKPLSKAEQADLAFCEAKIHGGLEQISKAWREIARCWCRIRDEKLYRTEFRTIEAYTRARFGKSAARLRQLIGGEGVMQDLEDGPAQSAKAIEDRKPFDPGAFLEDGPPRPVKAAVVPRSESVARPMVPVPREQRAAVWEQAREIAGAGKDPTAKDVAAAVQRLKPARPVLVQEHVRFAKPQQDTAAEIAFAETKAFDALAKLGDASRALKKLDLGLTQELYHADKAADHLGCLVKLLQGKKSESPQRREERRAEPKQQVANLFVICREPVKGAFGAGTKARYSGNGNGWTLNPDKVTPFKSFREAQQASHEWDRVMPLVKAQRRFARGL